MKTSRGLVCTLASLGAVMLAVMPAGVSAVTAAETIGALEPEDFIYTPDAPVSDPAGLKVAGLTIYEFPALDGQGVSMAVVTFDACSVVPAHVHPRAGEIIYVMSGKLQIAFVEESAGTRGSIVNEVSAGDSALFPEGLVHYQQNLECEEASFVAGFNSEDPGLVYLVPSFFALPDELIASSGVDLEDPVIAAMVAALPEDPSAARQECLARCGLSVGDDSDDAAGAFSCSGDAGVLSGGGGSCCPVSCGSCGGAGCSRRGDGADSCCATNIEAAGATCAETGVAPCLVEDGDDDYSFGEGGNERKLRGRMIRL